MSGNRNEKTSNLSVIQPAAYSGVFRRIGIGTTLKFPDRRIARAADGIKRDAPGNAAGAFFHRGKRILRPGSWQGLDVAARCLLLSRPLRDSLPNWGPRRRESSMSKPGLDGRHRTKDGEISGKHGNTLVRTLRKVYG